MAHQTGLLRQYLYLLVIALIGSGVQCATNANDEWPYTETLDVNNLFRYNLAFGNGYQSDDFTDTGLRNILNKILSRYKINAWKVNLPPVLKSLSGRMRWMRKRWTDCKGGHARNKLQELWQATKYAFTLPHKTGSPSKRKLENDLAQEEVKRKKLENDINQLNEEINVEKEKNEELERVNNRLKNLDKVKKGKRGRSRRKTNVSKSQQNRRKKVEFENVKETMTLLLGDNIKSLTVKVEDEEGKPIEVTVEGEGLKKKEYVCTQDDIDEMIFILDSQNIAVRGYHEMAVRHPNLPRSYKVNARRKELNSSCRIQETSGRYNGVWQSLSESLTRTLSDPEREDLIKDGKVRIKFSGDGTRVSERKNFVNVAYTIIGEDTCTSYKGNYLLAIVKCPEEGNTLKENLSELFEEFINLETVIVNGMTVTVEKFLGGDLKFLNQVMGIDGFHSDRCCLWCRCHKNERHDMSKDWSMSDVSKGARTVEQITKCSKEKGKDKRLNCRAPPLFKSIPITHVIPDTLHMFMRIGDQLIGHLVSYLQTQDHIIKFTAKQTLEKFTNIMAFEKFIHNLGITDWHFGIKDGKLHYRAFTGPEHRKILANIKLEEFMPQYAKLLSLIHLWKQFEWFSTRWGCKLSNSEIDEFQCAAKEWVSEYTKVAQMKDVTPYMHVLAFHLPEAMRMHGNIGDFCQQGLEKLNDFVTKWYFRSTNFGKNALRQVMYKQHRLLLLERKCNRAPKWKVTCSSCHEKNGHNKRSCPSQM